MSKKIFVNLPVSDLNRSVAFFTALGYQFNRQFTDETATCMMVSDDIYVMILTTPKFQSFIPNEICDTKKSTEVLICLNEESREAVTDRINKAIAAGASTFGEPTDYGFMFSQSFQDLDGHIWSHLFMDPSVVQPN